MAAIEIPGHQHALSDQIGPHLAGADDTDAHRPALGGAPGKITGKPAQGDVGHGRRSTAFRSGPQYRKDHRLTTKPERHGDFLRIVCKGAADFPGACI
ncbi:hypothetical protein ACVOMV_19060 [Mesorhizobium atlanticum]